jgi:hypothetical protein
MLEIAVVIVLVDFSGVSLSVNRDDQLGGTPFGIQVLAKTFLLKDKSTGPSCRITGEPSEFPFLWLSLTDNRR